MKKIVTPILLALLLVTGLALFLYLNGYGLNYPVVRTVLEERAIQELENEIVFGEKDILTYIDGYLISIDIKTQNTAAVLYQCIRNSIEVTDLSDVNLAPAHLPIQINGQGKGDFEVYYTTDIKTGRFIAFYFAEEDSKNFYEYVMALPRA